MAHLWSLPAEGTFKVNVHGATSFIPFHNGNTTGLRMIMRNTEGELLKLSTGVVLGLSPLQNQLRAIHHGMIKAFDDNYKSIIVETDNHEALLAVKNYPTDFSPKIEFLVTQIRKCIHDSRSNCSLAYVFPGRNPLAIYLARLGGEKCKDLYTFTRPIGAVAELMSVDLGFGSNSPMFDEIEISEEEADPVNFGPNIIAPPCLARGGFAFKEDLYAINNEVTETPVVVPVHTVFKEEMIAISSFSPSQFVEGMFEDIIF